MRMRPIVSVALAMVLPACGGEDRAEPEASPSPLGRRLTSGEAHVIVRGDVDDEFTVPLDPAAPNVFEPPNGGFALNWSDGSGNGFGVGGPLYIGSRTTGDDLSVSITAIEEDLPAVFPSFGGECEVSITAVTQRLLAGHFVCEGLVRGQSTIDAEGEFEASG